MQRNEVVDLQKFRDAETGKVETEDGVPNFLPPGTVLLHGQYSLDGYLNCGGFGITYVARDSLGRKVVIKECYPGVMVFRQGRCMASRSPAYQDEVDRIVRQFVTEAHNLANVRHENIVHVHQIFEENDTAYMAMDFVDGPDLLDMMDGAQRQSPREVQSLTRTMLDAISYIHGLGMLHRDISPDNILVEPDGKPVLIDFGAARHRLQTSQRKLARMKFVKDGYSPPEFYTEGSPQGAYSDLYSFAATLYHVVSGAPPVDGQTRLSLITEGRPDPCEPLAGHASGYPVRFLRAIDEALSVLPENRIQSADEWIARIVTPTERVVSAVSRPALAPVDFLAGTKSDNRDAHRPKWRRSFRAAASVAILGLVTAGGFALFSDRDGLPALAEMDAATARAAFSTEAAPRVTGPQTMRTAAVVLPRFTTPSPDRSVASAPVLETSTGALPIIPAAPDGVSVTTFAMGEVGPNGAASLLSIAVPTGEETIEIPPIMPETAFIRPQTLAATHLRLTQPELGAAPNVGLAEAEDAGQGFGVSRQVTAAGSLNSDLRTPKEEDAKPAFAERSRKSPDMPRLPVELPAPPSGLGLTAVAPTAFEPSDGTSPKFISVPRSLVVPKPLDGISASVAPVVDLSAQGDAVRVSHSYWDVQMPFEVDASEWNSVDAITVRNISPEAKLSIVGDWLQDGVVLVGFNGERISPDGTLAEHFLAALDVGEDGYARTTVRFVDPVTGKLQNAQLAVPVVRKTRLADGTLLVTEKNGAQWMTKVQSLGFAKTDLAVGDVIVARSNVSALSDAAAVAAAFDALVGSGATDAEFNVLRENIQMVLSWQLPGG